MQLHLLQPPLRASRRGQLALRQPPQDLRDLHCCRASFREARMEEGHVLQIGSLETGLRDDEVVFSRVLGEEGGGVLLDR